MTNGSPVINICFGFYSIFNILFTSLNVAIHFILFIYYLKSYSRNTYKYKCYFRYLTVWEQDFVIDTFGEEKKP